MVGKLEVEKDTVFWDRELTGFGVRVYPTGTKVYIAQARGTGGSQTCGGWPPRGESMRRRRAKRAALIISRIKAGDEAPVPEPIDTRRRAERWPNLACAVSRRNTPRCVVNRKTP